MPKAAAPPAGTAPRKGGDDMKLSKIEQETIINFNEADGTASIYTHKRGV